MQNGGLEAVIVFTSVPASAALVKRDETAHRRGAEGAEELFPHRCDSAVRRGLEAIPFKYEAAFFTTKSTKSTKVFRTPFVPSL
jgi:hypothetical protein